MRAMVAVVIERPWLQGPGRVEPVTGFIVELGVAISFES